MGSINKIIKKNVKQIIDESVQKNILDNICNIFTSDVGNDKEQKISKEIFKFLDKRGICGGISIILSELCNRVGITAYPVFGTIKSDGTLIPHGWVAMRVDDSTYYIDPTYVCQTGEMDNLKMKNEMERIGDRQYQLEDSFEY